MATVVPGTGIYLPNPGSLAVIRTRYNAYLYTWYQAYPQPSSEQEDNE